MTDRDAKEFGEAIRECAGAIRDVIEALPPEGAVAFLVGVITNSAGPMNPHAWNEILRTASLPCDHPDCDCHKLSAKLFDAIDDWREDWRRKIRSRTT